MRIVVNIKGELKQDDILIFDNGVFIPIKKDSFLLETKKENEKLKLEIENLKTEFLILKNGVNERLKSYHNILQTLTKNE